MAKKKESVEEPLENSYGKQRTSCEKYRCGGV